MKYQFYRVVSFFQSQALLLLFPFASTSTYYLAIVHRVRVLSAESVNMLDLKAEMTCDRCRFDVFKEIGIITNNTVLKNIIYTYRNTPHWLKSHNIVPIYHVSVYKT